MKVECEDRETVRQKGRTCLQVFKEHHNRCRKCSQRSLKKMLARMHREECQKMELRRQRKLQRFQGGVTPKKLRDLAKACLDPDHPRPQYTALAAVLKLAAKRIRQLERQVAVL